MAQIINFYQTEGRKIVYAPVSRGVDLITSNWEGTPEVKVKDGFVFITERAFKYVPELLDANGLPCRIVDVSKEQESQLKRVLDALGNYKGEELDSEEDDGELGVHEYLELELGNEVYVNVTVIASGVIKHDRGDYDTPPSSETKWGEIILDDLTVYLDEDDVVFNTLQEQVILDSIEQLITLR